MTEKLKPSFFLTGIVRTPIKMVSFCVSWPLWKDATKDRQVEVGGNF
jgi:hypothetical protein